MGAPGRVGRQGRGDRVEMRAHPGEETLPRVGQADPAGPPVEEPLSQELLQPAHLMAEGADREAQGGRRARQVARPGGGDEAGQRVEGKGLHLEYGSTRD